MTYRRLQLLIVLLLTIAAGLALRFYVTPLPAMVQKELGDVLWAVAAYAAIALCFPAMGCGRVAVIALVLACLSEASQLSNVPPLRWGRQFAIGRLLLGTGFSWIDMAMYPIGAAIAWGIDRALTARLGRRRAGRS